MTRGGQAWATAGGTVVGLLVGLGAARLATMSMKDQKMRADIVFGTSVATAAAGGGLTSFWTSKKLLTA